MDTQPAALEPLYTLKVAAALIPFPTAHALLVYLKRHGFPKRYRRGSHRGRVRLVTHSECVQLRAMVVTER